MSLRLPAGTLATSLLVSLGLAGCSAAPDSAGSIGTTSEAVCSEAYDWHDFPTGDQCVGAVDAFFSAHFGVGLPALCQYPSSGGCTSCGACEVWVANAPSPSVWDRMTTGTPQLFDMIVFPPIGTNAYGHIAVVDHVTNGAIYVMDDNYVGYQEKASCPHTVSWGAYGWYRLKSLADKPPQGWLDSATCTQISGWTYDPDTPTQSINVDLYFGGAAGSGAPGVPWVANVNRPDLCTAIGSCVHGYVFPTPLSLMDGAPHAVYPYGIDSSGNGDNPLLMGAPKSFTCPAPAIPYAPAVKRHVTDPTVFGAWNFSALTDLAHLADAVLDPVPQTADIPAKPSLVTPDDGSAGIYILDGSVARHVQDPASMTAWHFSGAELVKMPAAQFHALPEGLPWPESPFLAQGSGAAVYMIDVTTPPAADAGAEDTDGGPVVLTNPPSGEPGDPGVPGDAPAKAGGPPAASSGGCSASPRSNLPGTSWAVGLLLGLASMRRRCRVAAWQTGGRSKRRS